jgi:ubiquinone biosynthesis protein
MDHPPKTFLLRLASIPQLARNANRVRQIVTILSRYGLADWLSRLGLQYTFGVFRSPEGKNLTRLSHEARIRLALTELGTTFIKFGQILSTRPDLIGPELADELAKLQCDAPADPPQAVRATLEEELGKPLETIFAQFEETPLASASIGQVHQARLRDGSKVVVKVQHRDIWRSIRADLDILMALAELAETHIPELRNYRPRAVTADFQRILLRELDFRREARNLTQFGGNFRDDPTVRFPRPYDQFTTSRVLVMEYLEGIKVSDIAALKEHGHDLQEIARRGANLYLRMIFRDGFYHADPHPGNLIVMQDQVIGVLDCGMVGRIDGVMRSDLEEVLLALAQGDPILISSVIMRVGMVPPDLDEAALCNDVAEFLGDYAQLPIEQLNIAAALTDITAIIRRYGIVLPSGISLLIKVLVMLDGTARQLHPQFNLTELVRPFYERLLWQRLSPTSQWRRWRRLFYEWEYLGRVLPRGLVGLVQQLRSGKFDVHLEHKHLDPSVNRLVLGLLTSSLFLGSTLLVTHEVQPLIFGVSLPGATGYVLSVLLGLRLLLAIRRSGRLDG